MSKKQGILLLMALLTAYFLLYSTSESARGTAHAIVGQTALSAIPNNDQVETVTISDGFTLTRSVRFIKSARAETETMRERLSAYSYCYNDNYFTKKHLSGFRVISATAFTFIYPDCIRLKRLNI